MSPSGALPRTLPSSPFPFLMENHSRSNHFVRSQRATEFVYQVNVWQFVLQIRYDSNSNGGGRFAIVDDVSWAGDVCADPPADPNNELLPGSCHISYALFMKSERFKTTSSRKRKMTT